MPGCKAEAPSNHPAQPNLVPIPHHRPRELPRLFIHPGPSWRPQARSGFSPSGFIVWFERSDHFWRNPLAGALYQSVTGFDGRNEAASVSRDGQFIAFLSDRGGRTDVWVTQVGSGQFHNLTRGLEGEFVNSSIRELGFLARRFAGDVLAASTGRSSGSGYQYLGGTHPGRRAPPVPRRSGRAGLVARWQAVGLSHHGTRGSAVHRRWERTFPQQSHFDRAHWTAQSLPRLGTGKPDLFLQGQPARPAGRLARRSARPGARTHLLSRNARNLSGAAQSAHIALSGERTGRLGSLGLWNGCRAARRAPAYDGH